MCGEKLKKSEIQQLKQRKLQELGICLLPLFLFCCPTTARLTSSALQPTWILAILHNGCICGGTKAGQRCWGSNTCWQWSGTIITLSRFKLTKIIIPPFYSFLHCWQERMETPDGVDASDVYHVLERHPRPLSSAWLLQRWGYSAAAAQQPQRWLSEARKVVLFPLDKQRIHSTETRFFTCLVMIDL